MRADKTPLLMQSLTFMDRREQRWISVIGLASVMVLSAYYAWVAEDAFITLRTVNNFLNGHGLRWNIHERVQAYTHPLWMLLLVPSFAIFKDGFYAALVLGLLCTSFALWLLLQKIARTLGQALLAACILALSRSFIDYSTSGLENPLSHLCLALFFLSYFNERGFNQLFRLSLCASLLALSRLDLLLVCAPALLHAFLMDERPISKRAGAVIIGFAPLIMWEIFSLIYYGFLFPNTAYAKLNTGIPHAELNTQGWMYFISTLNWDPFSLAAIIAGMSICVALPSMRRMAVLIGMGLYVVYIVRIGGDFMLGRFLTPLVFMSAIIISTLDGLTKPDAYAAVALMLIGSWASPASPLHIDPVNTPNIDPRGLADERRVYEDTSSLTRAQRHFSLPVHYWRLHGSQLRERTEPSVLPQYNIGYRGFAAGPHVRLIDVLALADPLLARLPAKRDPHWRAGHFLRVIPQGYIESVYTGKDHFRDQNLGQYHQALRLVTEDPVWSWRRLKTIFLFNTGHYRALINKERYRLPDLVYTLHESLKDPLPAGSPFNDPRAKQFKDSGIHILLGQTYHAHGVEALLDSNDIYSIVCFRRGREIKAKRLIARGGDGLRFARRRLPEACVKQGYDALRIYPLFGDGLYSIGYLRLS